MKRIPFVPRLLAASAFCVAAVTFAGGARAGTLGVHDEAHSLSSQDTANLRAILASQPFDGRVAFTTAHAEPQDLARYARSILTEPDMVVVAVDPDHHHVRVEYGDATHVPRSAWPNIDRAGNAAFTRGAWEEGVADIFTAAGRSVDASAAPAPVDGPVVARRPSLFGPLLLIALVGGAVAVGLYFARRRSLQGPYGPGGYGPGGGYGPMGGPPYGGGYGPPPAGGLGPVGGGVIGAGLGGLAGYELGKLEGERENHERGSSGGGGSSGDDQGGGFDAGGGDSSWGDGGGGSDGGGGGGFDGGGGGSDF
ncbi:MAG TPA: TPM domain-containing protein [Polyangiaceae bacterium]|jgi:hypothetical protein